MPTPGNLPHWLSAGLFIGALAAAFWRVPNPDDAAFSAPPAATATSLPALFTAEMLPPSASSVDSPSLTRLPDGRIAAAWSAGPPDEDDDRAIWYSVLGKEDWRPPQIIASRESTAGGSFTRVSRIGSPLLYAEGGWLHLWYASRGGWSGNTLEHSVSTNGGTSWSKPARLPTSPLGGSLAQAAPLPLSDGGLVLPLSQQGPIGHGAYLRLSPTGQILAKIRLPSAGPTRQSAMLVFDEQHALALLRDSGAATVQILAASTANGGRLWQADGVLPTANPDTPLAVLRLANGHLLLAGNPQGGRTSLNLWLSADQGKTWQASRTVESAPDGAAEFTDPSLLLGSDGRIHLAYTWRRQGIKHAVFSEAWLAGEQP